MFEMPTIFSIIKSITPIIILCSPKISIVPMEIRVMMRIFMVLRDFARYMKAYTDMKFTT